MVDFLRRSWAVVDLDCIDHNIRSIKEKLKPGCMIMGVVKADAYGHGDKYIADELVRLGVNWFAVSNLTEAMSLRNQGIYHPILILGTTPPNKAKTLCEYNITQAVFSLEYAKKLQQQAQRAGVTVACHIKVDTGMGRIGFEAEQDLNSAVEEIAQVCQFPNLRCDGIFTHFSSADEYNEASIQYTRKQYDCFMQVCDRLQRLGVHFTLRHCCNSGGIVNYPEYHLDMVRAGVLIYGLVPDKACEGKRPEACHAAALGHFDDQRGQGGDQAQLREDLYHPAGYAHCHRSHWIRGWIPPQSFQSRSYAGKRAICKYCRQNLYGSADAGCHRNPQSERRNANYHRWGRKRQTNHDG